MPSPVSIIHFQIGSRHTPWARLHCEVLTEFTPPENSAKLWGQELHLRLFAILCWGCWPSWIHMETLPGSQLCAECSENSSEENARDLGSRLPSSGRVQATAESIGPWGRCALSVFLEEAAVTCCYWPLQRGPCARGLSCKVKINSKGNREICPL